MERVKKLLILFAIFGLMYSCTLVVDTNLPERVYLPQTYSIYFRISPEVKNPHAQSFLDVMKKTLVWEMYLNVPEEGDSYDTLATIERFVVKKEQDGWKIDVKVVFKDVSSGNTYPREFTCRVRIPCEDKAVKLCAKRIAYDMEDVLELPPDTLFGKPENNPGDSAELEGGY